MAPGAGRGVRRQARGAAEGGGAARGGGGGVEGAGAAGRAAWQVEDPGEQAGRRIRVLASCYCVVVILFSLFAFMTLLSSSSINVCL